ncbi:radical SAM protein [Sphingomonas qilianensis]|uniref:Radical SAM protein n=1 Tax=Sphingomonas qilianensis TaxID=1736690 RepID=A0ABU9XVJ5_9SPHN
MVLKVTSRCNLNCSYCYVYNMGDDGWRTEPVVMSREIASAAIARVAEHAYDHQLGHFQFVFHGGEPLLVSPDFYAWFVAEARHSLEPTVRTSFTLQTNAALLTRRWAQDLLTLGVRVGVSLDATRASHDRARVDHKGRGSYERALRGLQNARAAGLTPGLLIVVDPATDPDEVFEHIAGLAPRTIDFLLPQATWDNPPDCAVAGEYGAWLLRIFARWAAEPVPPFSIRLFENIIRTVLGRPRDYDALGPGRNATLTIETGGSIEPADVLRVCENGFTRRGLSVLAHSLDEALADPLMQAYYYGAERLSVICRACRVADLCAGGYLPHRYRRGSGFDNPSVYCSDLEALTSAIQSWTVAQLTAEVRAELGIRALA